MQYQFIFNEADIKALAPISQNVAGEYLAAAMFEAQAIDLKGIVGASLLRKLQECEGEESVPPQYEDLKAVCLPYLIYRTIVRLIPKVQYKIANVGAYTTGGENMQTMGKEDTDALIESYTATADQFCYELQIWLCDHESAFPELDGCACSEIRANLYSAATCGIWLGGPRGKMEGGCCR